MIRIIWNGINIFWANLTNDLILFDQITYFYDKFRGNMGIRENHMVIRNHDCIAICTIKIQIGNFAR